MAIHGYVTHAARNRRFTAWLVAAYLVAFQLIGAFALTMFLLIFDEEHTILSNPGGYAVRYALPIAALTGYMFWRMYRGHSRYVTRRLNVRMVERSDEPRFVQVAEEQCTALGVRVPRFGIIEVDEPNVVTVGEGPNAGLIAVTRGLLDLLDDDELAAVLAHEASHIRQGDTKLLAANHALMRTAVIMQTHNPLRVDDWRQMIIALALPPMLLVMLAGGATTMFSMKLARVARRGLKVGRDHVADGEAIRVTHYPEALIDALRKVGGRGAFEGSHAVEGLLFDGPADHDGGSHSAVQDRIAAIGALGGAMRNPGRRRRDTRAGAIQRPAFGLRLAKVAVPAFARDKTGRPLEQPPTPTLGMLWLYFTDREAFWRWQHACIAWQEWRTDDHRNMFGLTPRMVLPVVVTLGLLLGFHWPADGDLYKLKDAFRPTLMVEIARQVNSGPFCNGEPSTERVCRRPAENAAAGRPAAPWDAAAHRASERPAAEPMAPILPPIFMPIFLLSLIVVAIFRPGLLKKLFGVVERKNEPAEPPPIIERRCEEPDDLPKRMNSIDIGPRRSFGRKSPIGMP
jgi:Zn-dependent protease with chaperone function